MYRNIYRANNGQRAEIMKKVLLVGAGGHAKVAADILLQNQDYEIAGIVDEQAESGFWGIPVVGRDADLASVRQELGIAYAFAALGDGRLREKVTKKVLAAGYELINVISASARISERALLGQGIAVMPGAVINADVRIADGCIINTNASVDHDGVIGEFTHIAPGTAVSGYVTVGRQCLLGTGSRVIDRITIGDNVTAGAGSVIIRNINGNCTVVGVPAKRIR